MKSAFHPVISSTSRPLFVLSTQDLGSQLKPKPLKTTLTVLCSGNKWK